MLILKIIGIVLLSVIALILFPVLLLLFVPFRYSLRVFKDGDVFYAFLSVSFLLKFVEFVLNYDDKHLTKKLRIGFIPVNMEKKEEKDTAETEAEQPESTKTKEKKEKITFLKRIKNVIVNRDYIQKQLEKSRDAFKRGFLRVKTLLRHLLPRKLKGYVEFGFDDPATTGEVLGAIAVIYGMGVPELNVNPNFNEKVFKCNLSIKGRIRLFTVALLVLLLYSDKELKKTIRRLRRYSEITPEEKKNV